MALPLAIDPTPEAELDLEGDRLEAATTVDGNVLVMAGPGAGKTHLLVAHAAYLAQTQRGNVVVLTFSRNAAQELARRIAGKISPFANKRVSARTLHSYALDLLRSYGYRLGLGRPLEVLEDARDVEEVAREVAGELGELLPEKFVRRLERMLRRRALTPADRASSGLVGGVLDRMRSTGRLSWEAGLDLAIELVDTAPELLDSIRHHDRFLLLDEAQDCDPAQLELLSKIVGGAEGNHLFVAMDPDQSLYSFRDADPERVLAWARGFRPREYELTENYRCAPRIVALAKAILSKEAAVQGVPDAGTARFFYGTTRKGEACFVAQQVARRLRSGTPDRRIAVLGRNNYLLEPVLEALRQEKVPVRLRPQMSFSPSEQRVLAVFELLREWEEQSSYSPQTSRTLSQVFGVDQAALHQLEVRSLQEESFHPGDELSDPRWLSLLGCRERRLHPARLVQETGRIFGWDLSGNLSLHELAAGSRTLSQLLRKVRQGARPPARDAADGVLVTTFHGSKGLEFDVIFIVACEDGIIPDRRSLGSERELRQERRALYVALTRASSEVVVTCARNSSGQPSSPSRFLPERRSPIWTEAR